VRAGATWPHALALPSAPSCAPKPWTTSRRTIRTLPKIQAALEELSVEFFADGVTVRDEAAMSEAWLIAELRAAVASRCRGILWRRRQVLIGGRGSMARVKGTGQFEVVEVGAL
jgi:hypothetical protein